MSLRDEYEPVDIAQRILGHIEIKKDLCQRLDGAAEAKADALAEYAKQKQLAILRLREDKMQATLIPDIAKGQCAGELRERSVTESAYKSLIIKIQQAETAQNALQSIFRHLEKA